MAISSTKYTGVTKATKGHRLRVDYKQDTFIMETARLISMVGTAGLSTEAEKESLRGYIQQVFSDYLETKFNKKGAKTSTGASADLQMTDADAFDTFGVTAGITDAMRGIEIKSSLVSDTGTTITQVTAGTVAGQKRRFVVGSSWEKGASADGEISRDQLGQQGITIADDTLSGFNKEDQEKIDEITTFFKWGTRKNYRGKQIEVRQQARKGDKPRKLKSGLYLIPWNSDGTIDMQAISNDSIGKFVKYGNGAFARSIRTQIKEKMGEGVSFNFKYDALKKGKSAARFAPKGSLDLMNDYDYEVGIRTNPLANGYSTSFTIRPKLNTAGAKKFQDITVRFKEAPQKMMRDFMAYAFKRLRAQLAGESDTAKKTYLKNYIGYFKQFSIGTLTPYLIEGKLEVPSAKELIVKGRGKLLNKAKISGRGRTKQTRGRFLSNAQLSAILQKRLAQTMPRYPEPSKPTPRYVTGKLARSFQVMANYRTGLMGYLNTPPASGYVDELNQNGWMLDKTLVEPTIRQITQQLFGRQFRVLRTQ